MRQTGRRILAAGLVTIGAGGTAAAWAGVGWGAQQSAARPTLVAIPNAATDVAVSAAGDVRVATGTSYRSHKSALSEPLVPAGPAVPLLKATAKRSSIAGAFTPDGVLVSYQAVDRKGNGPLRAFTVRSDGSRTATRTISSAGSDAFAAAPATVGPTGAVALPFIERRPHRGRIERLAFRPAGSAEFGKPVLLGNATAVRDAAGFETLLGPDGGGVVIVRPGDLQKEQPYLRRLTPDGVLGPKLALDAPLTQGAVLAAAFAPSGNLVLAVLTGGPPYPTASPNTSLMTSILAPGSAAIEPFKRIDRGSLSAAANGNLAIAVGANDHTVILAGSDSDTDDIGGPNSDVIAQRIYEGTGADVTLIARLTAWFPNTSRVALSPDGAITAVWAEDETQSSQGDHLTAGVFGARRAPGGEFTTPRLLSTRAPNDGDRVEDLTPLDDGRVAVQYRRYGEGNDPGRSYVLFTRP